MDPTSANTFEHGEGILGFEEETYEGKAETQDGNQPLKASASSSDKTAFTLKGRKRLPTTIRNRTTNQLGPGGDESSPEAIDDAGETKVMPNGALCGDREYLCRTFTLPNHGEKLFMLKIECLQTLVHHEHIRSLYNRKLHEFIASDTEKDDLVSREILPPSYRLRPVVIATARSIFRKFGSRVILNGTRVRDDYWESDAREKGFTEDDSTGETRPGSVEAQKEATSAVPDKHLLHLMSHLRGYEAGNGLGNAFKLYRNYHEADVVAGLYRQNEVGLPDSTCDYASFAELPPVPSFGVGLDPSILSKTKASYQSPEEAFTRCLAHWSDSEAEPGNLALLLSLGTHRPPILPRCVEVGSTWQGWLRCEWELPSIIREMRESDLDDVQSLLGNFVTITGRRSAMVCSTCGQFIEKKWGESGTRALEVLARGVIVLIRLDSASIAYCSTISPGSETTPDVEMHINDTHIIVKVGKDHPEARSFIDAIVWVCTAVRVNSQRIKEFDTESHLQMSEATQLFSIAGIVNVRSQALVYGLEPLTKCSDEELGPQFKCWTGLFDSGTVAFSHSYYMEREEGVGLEISFDMMVHLSGVENVYYLDGGIILVGYSTALVPVSYDEDSKILQWHFEEVSKPSGGVLKPNSLLSICGNWYKTQDVDLLRSSKCFLGWFARANVLLGTQRLVSNAHNVIKWSTETSEHRQSVRRDGFETAGQFGFTAGPINTSIQLVKTWRFHSNVQHFHRQHQYSTALRLCYGNVSVIIDSGSKQVWLVPMLSVVLHLCHRYFQEVNQGSLPNNPIPFADPSPDGASAAAVVLEAAGETLVFGAAGDPDAENLRQLFLRINSNLLSAAETREPSDRKTLFATELMAMVTEPGRGSPLKKMKAPAGAESWVDLFKRVDFVGVCANIGHLIEPETPSHTSCTCSTLPSDRYLLAAHVRCLDVLSQREGSGIMNSPNRVCRLGERVFWATDKVHWTTCPVGIHEPIWGNFKKDKILQQISRKEKGKGKSVSGTDGQTELERALPVDGAVVFGGDSSKRTLQSWRLSEYHILQCKCQIVSMMFQSRRYSKETIRGNGVPKYTPSAGYIDLRSFSRGGILWGTRGRLV